MGTIKITLETLYDILRNEKKRDDLQKLEETFFLDVILYLQEKQDLLKSIENKDNIFAAGEKEKLEYELHSIKRILKEIYEKREKKIIDIALNKSKTGSEIIDVSSLLREEKEFYERLLFLLDTYRQSILFKLFEGKLPGVTSSGIVMEKPRPAAVNKPLDENDETAESSDTNLMMKIRFIHPVPSFVWKDMKIYGPFDAGEKTEIYPEVAQLLIRKGRAMEIN